MKFNGVIAISGQNNPKIDTHNDISVVFLIFGCDGGRRVTLGTAGGAGDVKSDGIIEISGPISPKLDTHHGTSVISFEFWCDGGRRCWRRADTGKYCLEYP